MNSKFVMREVLNMKFHSAINCDLKDNIELVDSDFLK